MDTDEAGHDFWRKPMLEAYVVKVILFRFAQDESGATAIEYGLIAALIAVVIITAVRGIGTKLNATFTSVSNGLGSN